MRNALSKCGFKYCSIGVIRYAANFASEYTISVLIPLFFTIFFTEILLNLTEI